ncbi:hypothetical protein DB35_23740 [Streptomyces abyssalis]|uniref:Uncharacterized protein n=1 Tax=Streptomyces abyssalis TaxID=933944 RepID=A0A1E7JNS4_9ACTN|nr:hypothetical protein [Streptomyces abyssalis]OEU86681.1 hypothetical protein DB35_23740 [Streptomyces abyssalis]OEU89932.1 hypothetical protein AN215_09795 [Streptomyces abyssalis]
MTEASPLADELPFVDRAKAWIRDWPRRPRRPLTAQDFLPHTGSLFLPTYLSFFLLYGGSWVLFGPNQTFRLGGFLALLGGAGLTTLIVLYIRRPSTRRR